MINKIKILHFYYCLAHEPFLICECGSRVQKSCRQMNVLSNLSGQNLVHTKKNTLHDQIHTSFVTLSIWDMNMHGIICSQLIILSNKEINIIINYNNECIRLLRLLQDPWTPSFQFSNINVCDFKVYRYITLKFRYSCFFLLNFIQSHRMYFTPKLP